MSDEQELDDGPVPASGDASTPVPGPAGSNPPPQRRPILSSSNEWEPTVQMPQVAPGRPGDPYEVELENQDQYDEVSSRPYVTRLEQQHTGYAWPNALRVGLVLLVIVAGIAFLARLRSGNSSDSDPAPVANPTVGELAEATVQILGLGGAGEPLCSGSGTFVSSDGMILTNAHVVTSDDVCDFSSIGIAVTTDSGRPPELRFRADLLVIDQDVDLAVLKVSDSLDAGQAVPDSFPYFALGDSDALEIGDNLRILGYPEIGGDTITFTNGSVSGFTAQAGIGDRALVKTDATIAGGNSGGAAVDADGRLVGIPTKARASESGPAVDCRPLADTNGDGEVDDADNCVPIGGFLNGIRPINLAVSLIDDAEGASPQSIDVATPVVPVDFAAVEVMQPRFSLGQTNNAPTEVVVTATGGEPQLCLFVDWSGIPDGAEWDGLWYYNQEPLDEYSLVGETWDFGETGRNFWMCAIDDEDGLEAGLYEIGFFLNGELVFAEGIVLTEEPVDVIATPWENGTSVDVCGLAINPEGSGPVGLNELEPGEVIPPGETIEVDLPLGRAVVEAYDCDGNELADSGGASLEIVGDKIYTIDTPTPPGDG